MTLELLQRRIAGYEAAAEFDRQQLHATSMREKAMQLEFLYASAAAAGLITPAGCQEPEGHTPWVTLQRQYLASRNK